jgi:hypothetical protein
LDVAVDVAESVAATAAFVSSGSSSIVVGGVATVGVGDCSSLLLDIVTSSTLGVSRDSGKKDNGGMAANCN